MVQISETDVLLSNKVGIERYKSNNMNISQCKPLPQSVTLTNDVSDFRKHEISKWNTNHAFYAWLAICYSTGPTSAMIRAYIPAVIQSIAHGLGHQRGSDEPCNTQGDNCYIKFGPVEIQYTSYTLYLKAIYTSVEGLISILLISMADFANYRKWLMILSVFLFGVLATPFIKLDKIERISLDIASILYCLLLCLDTVYQITEGSYIPIFMRTQMDNLKIQNNHEDMNNVKLGTSLKQGAQVSVLGMVAGNLGGITALLCGVIIKYHSRTSKEIGYHDFLVAITISGCITAVISILCGIFIPNLYGRKFLYDKKRSKLSQLIQFPFKRFYVLLRELYKYKEATKYVIAWVLWNISYSNFLSVFGLLFRSTLGIGSSDAEYTIFSFISYTVGCIGSLSWMFCFNWACKKQSCQTNAAIIKTSLYFLLFFGFFANFWGSLGVNKKFIIGFKYRWEFWLFEIIFVATSSAIRSLNRVVYSAMLPIGEENQYFGLEVMLGLATGWSESLIIALIQDKTGNSRAPFIPNCLLYMISIFFYWWSDIEVGMKTVNKW